MTRKIFIDGEVFFAADANILGEPILDGQDELGHGSKVIDEWLSDSEANIKTRFYRWYDRFKVTPGTGLSVNVSSGFASDRTTTVNLPSSTVSLFDNRTIFVYIEKFEGSLRVTSGDILPNVSIPLAKVTTFNGGVTAIADMRQPLSELLPYEIPETQSVLTGSCMLSFIQGSVPSGYLECNGQAVSRTTFANLFAAIGTLYGEGDGSSSFNVPNLVNRFPFVFGPGNSLGQTGGSDSFSLTTQNLPSHAHGIVDAAHSHAISQTPHSHNVFDSGHTHGASDSGHSHNINDPGHSHFINDPSHQHFLPGFVYDNIAGEKTDGDGSAFAALGDRTFNATTGISINNNSTNISVRTGNSNISVGLGHAQLSTQAQNANVGVVSSNTGLTTTTNTGSSQAVTHIPRFFSLRAFIKT